MSQPFGAQGFGQPGGMPMQGVMVPKPTSDIYTAMLGLALLFILIAIIVLAVVMSAYDWDYSAAGTELKVAMDTARTNVGSWLA